MDEIADPKVPIADVCEAAGFLSQSYFVRIFTEREGVSPSKWRRSV